MKVVTTEAVITYFREHDKTKPLSDVDNKVYHLFENLRKTNSDTDNQIPPTSFDQLLFHNYGQNIPSIVFLEFSAKRLKNINFALQSISLLNISVVIKIS
ncbi:hypothetical protein GEMRC1_010916 [Eukaryota sp. GEM-RC1]